MPKLTLATAYKPHTGEVVKVKSFSLRPSTYKGLKEIRSLFASKYSEPSLSVILDTVLAGRVRAYKKDPGLLADDVQDYRRRYGEGRK